MKVMIAPDSFKGSLSANQVGEAIKRGILKGMRNAHIEIIPMADGGEGTVDVLLQQHHEAESHRITVHNPIMSPIEATYITFTASDEQVAWIECAESSGLTLINEHERNPMNTNTYGLGEQIKAAIERGIPHIMVSLGGSATNDGGLGMLQALGWQLFDIDGKLLPPTGNPLLKVENICDQYVPASVKNTRFTVVCDVQNPFYGPNGAAYIFARQKGAKDDQIAILDQGLHRLCEIFLHQYGINVQKVDGSGAAGGLGGALLAALDGTIVSGIDTIIQLNKVEEKVKQADLIITGEGSIDHQTLMGKVPFGIAKLAKKYDKPVVGLGGRVDMNLESLNDYFDGIFSIQTECLPIEEAIQPTIASTQLEVTAEQIFRLFNRLI
ncbi:glycerate kinase [Oikeobacillus pervagus]|uniref:Glycerate kinase n=1 Tax=Oikeobacillus pervagus TaxID=1325931 RepID=A0AAJ1SWY5_9BACI|nr:glycerate kinase [Oikeobacillus pervagus]MDQ0214099.1 glycerate kinase [Oikeobacillus pervagus]